MGNITHWKLDTLYPSAQALNRLTGAKPGAARPNRPFLGRFVKRAIRIHGKDIDDLTAHAPEPLRRFYRYQASNLYAVYDLHRERVQNIRKVGYGKAWQTWRMMNCRPAGGRWTLKSGVEMKSNCNSAICPWCWLRRQARLIFELKAVSGDAAKVGLLVLPYGGIAVFDKVKYRRSGVKAKRLAVGALSGCSWWLRITSCRFRRVSKISADWNLVHSYLYPVDHTPRRSVERTRVMTSAAAVRCVTYSPLDLLGESTDTLCRFLTVSHGRRTFDRKRSSTTN